MSAKNPEKQLAGLIGGAMRAAYAPDLQAMTAPARAAKRQKLLDDIAAKTGIKDEAELNRRADLVERARLLQMSARAARARRLRAEAAAIENELGADGDDAAAAVG